MSAIRLEHLVKRFGSFTALKTMDLSIKDGEFLALLGPSGCGKSTTMNMIAGMETPTEGRILFGDRDMSGVAMGRRGVGFVFQNYAIFTHMTVRQNLDYGLRMARRPRDEIARRTADIAAFLQLTDLLDRPSAGLSVNILQRVAIGRSAMMEPAIFLLDEPLSNVDAAFRAVMRTELKHLQRQFKQTMVYVTHDQLEAMTMADRIAVMDHGVLQQVGTPLEVYNDPANTFVAGFIGAPGMNILPATLRDASHGASLEIDGLGQSIPLPPQLAAAARQATKGLLLGFRPEQVSIATNGAGIAMTVGFVERIGARSIVHLERGGIHVKAVFEHDLRFNVDETVSLELRPEAVRLFDAASGVALRMH